PIRRMVVYRFVPVAFYRHRTGIAAGPSSTMPARTPLNPQGASMNRRLYTLLFYLLMPPVLLRLAYRSLRAPAYARRVPERFGRFDRRPPPGGIWVHAVSVGETIAAAPLVRELQARYPEFTVTLTTMTPTGSERARALFGGQVFHVYAPY